MFPTPFKPVPETIVGRIIGISISNGICGLIADWQPRWNRAGTTIHKQERERERERESATKIRRLPPVNMADDWKRRKGTKKREREGEKDRKDRRNQRNKTRSRVERVERGGDQASVRSFRCSVPSPTNTLSPPVIKHRELELGLINGDWLLDSIRVNPLLTSLYRCYLNFRVIPPEPRNDSSLFCEHFEPPERIEINPLGVEWVSEWVSEWDRER